MAMAHSRPVAGGAGQLSRRQLLASGAALGGATLLGGAGGLLAGCSGESGPQRHRIVIVGAGLAGLACAHRLHGHGHEVAVFEARPDRIGGRCWSALDWADGQVAEHGGEFIDSRHARMLAFAREFGLTVVDLFERPYPGSFRLWLKGARRYLSELSEGRRILYRSLRRDLRIVGPYRYDDASAAARAFDEMSVKDWLDRNLPDGGSQSLEGRFVWAQMMGEFGLDAGDLSALNLFYEYVETPRGADERFHIQGGNDQVAHGLYERLPEGTVRMDAPLEALWSRGNGSIGMRFAGVSGDVIADQVVLSLPFTNLRDVDLSGAELSPRKRACIDELGMGTNAKVLMQFERRPPHYGNWSGGYVTDDPYYVTWESSHGEPGRAGLITFYLGGRSGGADLDIPEPHMPAPKALSREALRTLDRDGATGIRGIAEGWDGRAWVDHWAADPWVKGAYAAFLPGQYTKFYGFAGKPEAPIHFAGEHTALSNQGYMEGALETGERCAKEVMAKLGAGSKQPA